MINLNSVIACAIVYSFFPAIAFGQSVELPPIEVEPPAKPTGDRKVISIGHDTAPDTFNVSVREYTYPDDDPNHVVAFGWNTTTDGQENTAHPSAGLYFERNFNNPGAPDAFEFHLQSYGENFARRYMSFYMPRNGDAASSAASIAAGTIIFGDADQTPIMQIDTTSRSAFMAPATVFSFNGNNTAVARQLNAAGTAYIPLWFVDDKDNYAGARPIALSTTFGNDVLGSDALVSLVGRGATDGSVGIRVEASLSAVEGTYRPLYLTGNASLSDAVISNAYAGGVNRLSLLSDAGVSEVLLGDIHGAAGARIAFDGQANRFRIGFGPAAATKDIFAYDGEAGSIAIGTTGAANGQRAVAIGDGAAADGAQSVAVGANAQASGYASSATGTDSVASGYQSMANGLFARATGDFSMAFGRATFAAGAQAAAIGPRAIATGINATGVGGEARATAAGATAVGALSSAGHANSTAVGTGATTTAANQLVLGNQQTSVVVAGIDASTDAQQGPVDVVTVDASGTLGRQRVATAQSVQSVHSQMEYIAAVSDSQFADLSGRVSLAESRMDGFDLRLEGVEGGVAAAMAMGQAKLVPDANISMTIAAATYGGQQGYAGSISGRLAEKLYISGSVSGNSGDKRAGGAVSATFGF